MEFRANALDGSQVKVHEMGDGWSEDEVTEWSPTHRSDKREMQFTVDVRDAFGREDIDPSNLFFTLQTRHPPFLRKNSIRNNELKLDNDGLVGNFTFHIRIWNTAW